MQWRSAVEIRTQLEKVRNFTRQIVDCGRMSVIFFNKIRAQISWGWACALVCRALSHICSEAAPGWIHGHIFLVKNFMSHSSLLILIKQWFVEMEAIFVSELVLQGSSGEKILQMERLLGNQKTVIDHETIVEGVVAHAARNEGDAIRERYRRLITLAERRVGEHVHVQRGCWTLVFKFK